MSADVVTTTPPFSIRFAPKIVDGLIADRVAGHTDRVILLHPTEARWALTDDAGLELVLSLDGTHTVGDILDAMALRSPTVDRNAVAADLARFLVRLYETNLVENAPLSDDGPSPVTKRPPSLTIYITEQCNLRCKHCSIVEGKMPETLLTGEDIRRLIDEHTRNHQNPTVAFLGGEPLMRPDCLDLLAYACERTTTVNMSTNGLYVDAAMASRLASLPVNVQVSLDGADPDVHDFIRGKGTFAKTWAAIELLVAAGGARRLTVATALTRCVFPQVTELIERCDALGLRAIRFLPLDRSKAANTNWDDIAPDPREFTRITRYLIFDAQRRPGRRITEVHGSFPGFVQRVDPRGEHWCPLGQTHIVDSQGNAYNCPLGTSGDVPPVGNIYKSPLADIAAGRQNIEARVRILQRRYAVEECRACAWRNFCQGGCTAFMAHRSGSPYINDEFCEFRRDLYREHVIRGAEET